MILLIPVKAALSLQVPGMGGGGDPGEVSKGTATKGWVSSYSAAWPSAP